MENFIADVFDVLLDYGIAGIFIGYLMYDKYNYSKKNDKRNEKNLKTLVEVHTKEITEIKEVIKDNCMKMAEQTQVTNEELIQIMSRLEGKLSK